MVRLIILSVQLSSYSKGNKLNFKRILIRCYIKAAFTRDRIRLEPVRNWYGKSLVFTLDLVDPVRIRSAIWYQMGPLINVIPYKTVPALVSNRCCVNRVNLYHI